MLWRPYARRRVGSLTLPNLTVEPKQKALLGSAGRPQTIRLRRSITPNTISPYWLVSSTPSPGQTQGTARYLLTTNSYLGRALRTRWQKWSPQWTSADGLVKPSAASRAAIAKHALGMRSYSPTALQNYAACPYKFFLQAIHRLAPREVPEAIDELDPLQRGSLIHEIQFELFERLRAANLLPVSRQNLERVRQDAR